MRTLHDAQSQIISNLMERQLRRLSSVIQLITPKCAKFISTLLIMCQKSRVERRKRIMWTQCADVLWMAIMASVGRFLEHLSIKNTCKRFCQYTEHLLATLLIETACLRKKMTVALGKLKNGQKQFLSNIK
jgi:hypothetical protein